MQTVYISLPTVRAAQSFVAQISKFKGNFDIQSGKYILDAKSLLGILSLDLTKPLKLVVGNDTKEVMKVVSQFCIDGKDGGE